MKKLCAVSMVLLGVFFLLLIVSCNPEGSNDETVQDYSLWSDSVPVESVLTLSNDADTPAASNISSVSSARAATDSGSKVYFRSSAVDFWSISGISDLANLTIPDDSADEIDANITAAQYEAGRSLSYNMGDTFESIVFAPGINKNKSVGATYNSNWNTNVTVFINSTLENKINLARLDIGSGMVTFIVNGQKVRVLKSGESGDTPLDPELLLQITNTKNALISIGKAAWDGTGRPADLRDYPDYDTVMAGLNEDLTVASGINANSIIFIDKQYLSKPVCIDLPMDEKFTDETSTVTAADLGLTADEFSFVTELCKTGISDGSLCLPFTPLDLTGFDPATKRLEVIFNWKIANSVEIIGGNYFMKNRVNKTPFDFGVSLRIVNN